MLHNYNCSYEVVHRSILSSNVVNPATYTENLVGHRVDNRSLTAEFQSKSAQIPAKPWFHCACLGSRREALRIGLTISLFQFSVSLWSSR
jgi:hypothetical protein